MIALVLLILAIVVIGGGVEVVRRMRFGGGAAAAHHRALDTLGQLTNQGADRRVDLAPPAGTPLLDHVRRVVEADPTHPRISPRPISRPVTIPSAVLGSEAPAPAPEEAAARPAPTEIEGVRILLPDPPPAAAEEIPVEAVDDTGVDTDDDPSDEVDLDETAVGDEVGTDDSDVDRGEDDDEDGEDGWVAAADADTAVVARLDDDAAGPDVLDEDPLAPPADGFDEGIGHLPWDEPVGAEPVIEEPEAEPAPAPVGAVSLADHRSEDANGAETRPVTGDRQEATRPDELAGAIAGTPVSPPTSADGAESVRVLRSDEIESPGADDRPYRVHHVEKPAARTPVAATPRSRDLGSRDLGGGAGGASAGLGDMEGFRILPPSEGAPTVVPADASDLVTDEVVAVTAAPDTDDRPWRHSGGAPAVAGTFHPAAPEQTRAQLAALARSGRVEPVGGGGGAHRSHTRRSRRAGGHARSPHRPVRHRGLRVATATLAVVVAAVGVVSAVVITNQNSSNQRARRTAVPVTARPAPTTTAPVVPASLVSRTSSTATYQVTGSPTISFVGSGSCWIEIRQGDQTGKVLFEGVLSSGSQKSQTGPFWVRLGNPSAISVQVNGMTLNQPAGTTGNPYNLQFQ